MKAFPLRKAFTSLLLVWFIAKRVHSVHTSQIQFERFSECYWPHLLVLNDTRLKR